MTLENLQKDLIQSVHNLSTKDKLYLILLGGAIVRSVLVFTNFDTGVYQVWLEYFLQSGELPYFDHPPAFFLVSAGLTELFEFLRGSNPYIYWSLFILPFIVAYRYTRDKSPYLFALLVYLLLYVSFVGYIGNLYETAVVASVFAGTVFIYLAYLLGSSVLNVKTGLYAALFTAFGWWPVVYSSTLLIDMFASVAIVAAYYVYYLFINREKPKLRHYLLTTGLLTLAFYTKYYALLIAPVIAVYSLWKIRDTESLIWKSVPGVISAFLFLLWAFYTDFYFLGHYAATYYRFLNPPGALSFVNFMVESMTPLLLIMALLGVYNLRQNKDSLIFLTLPIFLSLIFHMVQVFVLQRSHSLINLTNYMLYIFPFIAVLAGFGWRELDIWNKDIVVFVLVAMLALPLLSSAVQMEYDESYRTPTNNLNTLSADQVSSLGLTDSQTPTLHYVYSFERDIPIWGSYERREAHFRWMSPTQFQVVALEPVYYRITLASLEPVNMTLYQGEKELGDIQLTEDEQHIYVRPDQGKSVYRFESNKAVPFVSYKRNCARHLEECPELNRSQNSSVKGEMILYD